MIEVIEEVCDACIVDVATDDDKLLLVVHLKAVVRNDHGLFYLVLSAILWSAPHNFSNLG